MRRDAPVVTARVSCILCVDCDQRALMKGMGLVVAIEEAVKIAIRVFVSLLLLFILLILLLL